jgi:hypothetical protein
MKRPSPRALNANYNANYYGVVGSYRGAYKVGRKWIGVREFNRHSELKPKPLRRWQGPPSSAILRALQNPEV